MLVRYGSEEHKEKWLKPLLAGEIRSCFAMTEPAVASSDATNIESRIERDGDDYVINGRKWWITGAGDRRCEIFISSMIGGICQRLAPASSCSWKVFSFG